MDANKGIEGNVLITGGSGSLGNAIVRRATAENWPCTITVFSRDPVKQLRMKRDYPHLRYVLGDVRDYDGVYRAIIGHDVVIHAGAMKHIPEGEINALECLDVNINGSINVASAALQAGVKKVIGISTDKVAYPVNCYGITKKALEYTFWEYNRFETTSYHLCRYGNVLGTTGSVVKVWRELLARDGYVTATSPDMSRFWMTVDQAVDIVLLALNESPGTVVIPLVPALDMRRFAEYTMPEGTVFRYSGLRPGEKLHERLLTEQEIPFVRAIKRTRDFYYLLLDDPATAPRLGGLSELATDLLTDNLQDGYTSDRPVRSIGRAELLSMIGEA